jgi:hypothetical protein
VKPNTPAEIEAELWFDDASENDQSDAPLVGNESFFFFASFVTLCVPI